LALAMVALCVFIGYFVNHLNINTENWMWEQEYLFAPGTPAGNDFRAGLYRPAEKILHGRNPYTDRSLWYPPFSVLLAMPFQLLDENRAYLAQVGVLIVMNIATLGIALKVSRGAFAPEAGSESIIAGLLAFPLFCVMALWQETSYGFIFSVERGNFDIYTAFAAVMGLWLMATRPRWIWLQVLCFSIAAHLKVYPAILFVLVVWKHGWKSLLPLAVVNLALLLSLGPANVRPFLGLVSGAVTHPKLWQGNHSAAIYAVTVNAVLAARGLSPVPALLFYAVPTAVWAFGCFHLIRRGYSDAGAVWLFALSVPMMNLIPATSNDYKLVLLGAPLAVAFFFVVQQFASTGRWIRLLQTLALGALAAILAVSYIRLPMDLGNKYPFILMLQVVFVWILVTPRTRSRAEVSVTDAASAGADAPEQPRPANRLALLTKARIRPDICWLTVGASLVREVCLRLECSIFASRFRREGA
jgi:hypothetical protein